MAAGTTAGDPGVIHSSAGERTGRTMAGVTGCRRDNVFSGLAGRSLAVVAACAPRRCSLEATADVAARAFGEAMRSGERKPGRKMVEAAGRRRLGKRCGDQHQHGAEQREQACDVTQP